MSSRRPGGDVADGTFAGDGEMARLMREMDWSSTPLGPVEGWPRSLQTAVSICLDSRFPILLWWGPELVMLYNDAYRPMLGATKHPAALGAAGREIWPEIWHIIGPMLEGVANRGEATWSDNQMLPLDRNGYVEECYFTFSYSPIRDESGGIGGVFTAVTETTGQVLSERRLRALRELATRAGDARTAEETCAIAAAVLAEWAANDVPFALLYLLDGQQARLAGAAGVAAGTAASPYTVDLALGDDRPWPLARAATGEVVLVPDIEALLGRAPGGGPAASALVMPLSSTGVEATAGVLVAGVSAHHALDAEYRGFFDLLAAQIVGLIADARAHEAERQRVRALEDLDRAKTAFFSTVSHEFRTPLTLALGPLEEVLDAPAEQLSSEVRPLVEVAHRNSLRLLKLVNSLLDFSRIEAGRIRAQYEPVDLAGYTADLASLFRSAIERAGLTLQVDCDPLPEPVYVDRDMWEKIVLNLLSNALKYTPNGEIGVTVFREGDSVTLSVRDTGIGVAADDLHHIFERFHRVETTQARTHEGTGIGLALVQELVRLHGGEISVESAVGAGSTFRVTVPVGTAHLPADRIASGSGAPTARSAASYVGEALGWLPDGNAIAEPRMAGDGPRHEPSAPAARIVVADDNADMRAYIHRLLPAQWEIEEVADGRSTLQRARQDRPDLVLLDVMMPGLDGFDVLHELRSDERTTSIPVIMLSARAGEEARVEGLEAGADAYLVKPFSAQELLAQVEGQLQLARLRGEAERIARLGEERWRLMADSMPQKIFTARPNGDVDYFNPQWTEFTGLPFEAIRDWGWTQFIHPEDVEENVRRWRRSIDSGCPFEFEHRFRRADGVYRWHLSRARVVRADDGQVVMWIGSNTDIDDRKRAEEAAALAQQHAQALAAEREATLTQISHGVVVVDSTGTVTFVNPAAKRLFGVDPTSCNWEGVSARVQPLGADGKPLPGATSPLLAALQARTAVRDVDVRVERGGGVHSVLQVSAEPIFAADGALVGAVGTYRDVTAERELERQKEDFLSAAAHDLKNPVAVLLGQTQLLRRRAQRGPLELPRLLEVLEIIEGRARVMTRSIDELLDITQLRMGHSLQLARQRTDVIETVRVAVTAQQGTSDDHTIVLIPPDEPLTADWDAPRVTRVLGNLLANAVKYSPLGSDIEVRVTREARHDADLAVIAVRDQGMGIPAGDLPHIFDWFYRAGNVVDSVSGTGIGLAGARQIVEGHGGSIEVRSRVGEGSTFTVRLPLTGE